MTADTTTARFSTPDHVVSEAWKHIPKTPSMWEVVEPLSPPPLWLYEAMDKALTLLPATPSSLTPAEREYLLSRVTSELSDYSGDQRHMTKHAAEPMELLRGLADKLRGGVAVAPVAAQPGAEERGVSDLPPGLVLVATPYRDAPNKWMLIELTKTGRAKVITGGYIETEKEGIAHAHNYAGDALSAARASAPEAPEVAKPDARAAAEVLGRALPIGRNMTAGQLADAIRGVDAALRDAGEGK